MEWMKFGWGSSFNPEFDKYSKLYIDIANIKYTKQSLLEVSKKVIDQITSTYPEPYYLMVSGGIDSQALLWCWLNSGKKFTPISIRYIGAPEYKEVLNQHDLDELETFSAHHELNITYVDFDVINFLEKDLETYAINYQCTSPQICTHMKMSELITDGTVIFSGNFMNNAFLYTYTILGLKRYADITKRNFIPFFFLQDNVLAGLAGSPLEYQNDYESKVEFYKDLGVPVVPQKNKQTGFEEIKDYYDTRDDLVITTTDRLRYASRPSKRKFDIIFRYKLTEKVKYNDNITILGPTNNKY
jgi:hypothetical protein